MARMHGEHKDAYAQRQAARAILPDPVVGGPVEVETACPCADRPYPHFHPAAGKAAAIRRFNQESTHPLKEREP